VTDFTRVTVVGATRRATLVIPSDETLGSLIPRLVELLDERVAPVARPLTLLRVTGEQLDTTATAADQGLADGEVLRLLRLDEAPPPPEVSDVTDVVSDSLDARSGLWGATPRLLVGGVGIGLLVLVAGTTALDVPGTAPAPLVAWAVCSVLGLGLGLAGASRVAWALLAAALGAALPAALAVEALLPTSASGASAPWSVAAPTAVAVWTALFLVAGLGRRSPSAALGSAVGLLGALLATVLDRTPMTGAEASGVLATVAVVVVGLVPWYAMSLSGLTGLDDQVITGRLARREVVLTTVDRAYRTLTWATFGVATTLAVALLGLADTADPWARWLGIAVVVVTALRTRAFPLAAQVAALWGAVVPAVLVGVGSQLGGGDAGTAPLALAGLAVVVALLVLVRPARHQRASLRRVGNVLETLGVVVLVPLLIGSFDVYAQLLGSF
jgi:hypothetical protein